MFDRREGRKETRGEVFLQEDIAAFLVAHDHCFTEDRDDLKSLLSVDPKHLSEERLLKLRKAVMGLFSQIQSAQKALNNNDVYFIDQKPDALERTRTLVAQKDRVKHIQDYVSAEVVKRRQATEEKTKEDASQPFKKEFEPLTREEILERLVGLQDELRELTLEKTELDESLDYTSDITGVERKRKVLEATLDTLELRINAAKTVAKEKKGSS